MKLKTAISRIFPFFAIFLAHPIFANTVIVSGIIPPQHQIQVTPIGNNISSGNTISEEVALIEINNNLPSYQVEFNFENSITGENEISEVRIESVGGILGEGLVAPQKLVLQKETSSGKYIWFTGTQTSATKNYSIKLSVTYKHQPKEKVLVSVSMPSYL